MGILTPKALEKHLYILGGTGTGKSKLLEGLLIQMIRAGAGVGLVDPHGELYDNLVGHIAKHGRRLWDRVVLFDPLDPNYSVGFNPLELKQGEVSQRRAQFLSTVIVKMYGADQNVTVRMQRIMFHAFWLLIRFGLTLLEYAPLLNDVNFRAGLLIQLPQEDRLRRYWDMEFPQQERLVREWAQSSLNKVDPLAIDPSFRLIFGQKRSTIDFRQIIDEGKILLVKLSKGILGEANSHLMGAFVLAQMQLAALSRAEQAGKNHRHFTLAVDEFQNYVTDDIHEILAESRKYQLRLVMAHQYYEQLRDVPKLQAAVMNTVGNLLCFRLGAENAEQFVKDIFTPDFYQVKDVRKRRVPTNLWWHPYIIEEDVIWKSVNEIWENEMRRLIQVPDRFFWYKRRGLYEAQLLRSLTVPDPEMTSRLMQSIDELRHMSSQQYARPRPDVEREIDRLDIKQDHRVGLADDLSSPFDS